MPLLQFLIISDEGLFTRHSLFKWFPNGLTMLEYLIVHISFAHFIKWIKFLNKFPLFGK